MRSEELKLCCIINGHAEIRWRFGGWVWRRQKQQGSQKQHTAASEETTVGKIRKLAREILGIKQKCDFLATFLIKTRGDLPVLNSSWKIRTIFQWKTCNICAFLHQLMQNVAPVPTTEAHNEDGSMREPSGTENRSSVSARQAMSFTHMSAFSCLKQEAVQGQRIVLFAEQNPRCTDLTLMFTAGVGSYFAWRATLAFRS